MAEVESFVAGKLSAEETTRFERHLASCAECRSAVKASERDRSLAQGIQQAYEKAAVSDWDSTSRHRDDSSIADSIAGYEILHEIHRGGQGVVYKAVQLATKRTVALKVLLQGPFASPKQQHRFEREIDLVASLQHPNIVTVYDSGVAQGRHYFAMEYIHGQSLDAYRANAELTIDEKLRLFQKICAAVNAAHQRGVIHRDLKPGNIRVDSEGEPHVLDFGLAKAAGPDLQGGMPVTMSNEFMGTLAYASPEQTKGDPRLVDIRTDVYSLGVILYELLTGKYPYQVVGPMAEVLRNIAEVEPMKPSTICRYIDDEIDTIVSQALTKDKERRYQTAEALGRDVGHYLAGEPLDAKRTSTWYVIRKSLRRYRVAVGVAVAFVLVLSVSTIALSIMYRNQSLAREEAERAGKAEEEQRKVAERREREALAARASEAAQRRLAEQRADELQTVTEFQQSMLGEIDAGEMGRALYADLRRRVRDALEAEGMSPEETESTAAGFDQVLRRTNATDAALKLVDEQVLSRAVRVIESDFADQPVVRAALQQTVASTYRKIGRYTQAMPLQEAALQTRRAELGNDHPDTLASIDDMGNLLMEMGEFEDAQVYCREALEGRRRVLGDDHPATLESINNIGYLLQAQGKLAEAEPFFREAVEKKRIVLGDDHPDTLISIANLGFLLQAQGRLAEAEPFYREALEGRRRVLGDEHQDTLDSINNMGILLRSQGKLAEAEPYFHEVLEGFRRVLGEDHPRTLISLNNMGALLYTQGRLDEAKTYWREALEGRRRVLGDEHPSTLSTINNFGFLLQKQGRLVEAESYWREALEGRRRVLGNEHPNTLASINTLGFLFQKQGKLAEAEHYYREALESRRRVLGDGHPSTLRSVHNVGAILREQGKLSEAEGYYREALEGRRRVLGEDHPDTLDSISNMGSLLREQGKLEEAEPYYREAVEGKRRTLGDDHRDTMTAVHNLGRLLRDLGKLEEARICGAKAVHWARKSLPQGHQDLAVFLRSYGMTLSKLKRYADADAALMEAYEILETAVGASHQRTVKVVHALIDLYDAWHAAEPDGGYDGKAAAWRARLEDSTSQLTPPKPSGQTGVQSLPQPSDHPADRRKEPEESASPKAPSP